MQNKSILPFFTTIQLASFFGQKKGIDLALNPLYFLVKQSDL
jgi:hypothetical protein